MRFEPPATLNVRDEKKPANVQARLDFFDGLAAKIKIPGIEVGRNRAHDHRKAMNGGIGLKYPSHFPPDPALKSEVLLEIGFHQTAPNEPRDFTSWALDKALTVGLDVVDNSAKRVKCFNPEYTFVDKLQTICRFYRQHRDGKEGEKPLPRVFLRHYYDFYMLLAVERVVRFIGSKEYQAYKAEKLKGGTQKSSIPARPLRFPIRRPTLCLRPNSKRWGGCFFHPARRLKRSPRDCGNSRRSSEFCARAPIC
ncbi:MAG: nucleotidyl transferase AbiEii/AbiGii toxin family protein [Elusimicrobiota bacterium]|nr:MAG: nucleotidyl transferase AbiEii/AbiGii toxin family protein [Elusimicrobiota bacterium]